MTKHGGKDGWAMLRHAQLLIRGHMGPAMQASCVWPTTMLTIGQIKAQVATEG